MAKEYQVIGISIQKDFILGVGLLGEIDGKNLKLI
jgi:hypothetical protein